MTDRRRAAVIFPSGRLELNVTVKHLAAVIADAGFDVDVCVVVNRQTPLPVVQHPSVQIRTMPGVQERFQESTGKVTVQFARWFLPLASREKYDLIVAAGIRGLFVAALASMMTRRPFVYHSIEIYPSWEHRSLAWRFIKRFENWCMRRAKAIVIQDPIRAELLARDSHLPLERFAYFPVSSDGPVGVARDSYLRDRLGLSAEKKIVLYAGSLTAPFAPIDDLIRVAQEWPQDWVLVLQSNSVISDPALIERWQSLNRAGKALLRLEPVPYSEVGLLNSSADIGLAVYHRSDDNMYYMGLSSGKFAECLRVGLPVIVSRWPGIAETVEQYGCGMIADDFKDITGLVSRILAGYDQYSQAAVRAFREKLDIQAYAAEIQSLADRIASPKRS